METTVNMHNDTLRRISRAASGSGISRTGIIMMIIKEIMNHLPDTDQAGSMVRYQESRSPEEWHTFHIQVRMDEYEYLLDLRKLFKMSVSLIIALGVEKYLDRILRGKGTDNNRFTNYVVIREIVDSIICWKLFWGYPPNIEKQLPCFHDPTQ